MLERIRRRLAGRTPAPDGQPHRDVTRDTTRDTKHNTKTRGDAAEDRALAHLQQQGLELVQRNYRVARGPGARGGEIDLVMRAPDGTLVFVEVRARAKRDQGGAAASIGAAKQHSLVFAARHFLMRWNTPPPCRFDVVAIDGEQLQWLQAAFELA